VTLNISVFWHASRCVPAFKRILLHASLDWIIHLTFVSSRLCVVFPFVWYMIFVFTLVTSFWCLELRSQPPVRTSLVVKTILDFTCLQIQRKDHFLSEISTIIITMCNMREECASNNLSQQCCAQANS